MEKEEMTGIKRGSRGDGGRMKKSRERQSEEGGEGLRSGRGNRVRKAGEHRLHFH